MAIQPQTPYKEYDANGVTTSFALEFDCEKKDHLIVTVDGIDQPVETWSLNSGHIVFASAPAACKKIEIKRNTPYSRSTNFQVYDNSFRPGPVNMDFDRIWLKLQELGVADMLLKIYVDQLHSEQKNYIDQQDNQRNSYFENLIDQQSVSLQQLDSFYNYLMSRIAAIAVEKGWDANFVADSSGRNQQQINDDFANVKNWGAIGDGTLHTVREWFDSGKYSSLQHIQVKYPHVTSLDDSIDWAAIQKALNTGKDVVSPKGNFVLGEKSLYAKTSGQNIQLSTIQMDASLGKACLHVGASDENGTRFRVAGGAIKGRFRGVGDRANNSCGLNLVDCTQFTITPDAQGFYAGIGLTNTCYANTIITPYLIKNTYGIANLHADGDLQGSIVVGGRIEQNQKEGIKSSTVNTTFSGTVIEGNGLWDGGTGETPEVTVLGSSVSGAVTFQGCYLESLNGKSAQGIIEIEQGATRHVFINGGHYFGGVANKGNIVVVNINSPASSVVSVQITGAYVNDVKNYARGVISGNSQVSIMNCMPREPLVVWQDVTVGIGNPLIQQFDRTYWYTNQNIRPRAITASGPITCTDLTATGTATAAYFIGTSNIIGLSAFNGFYQLRHKKQDATSLTPIVALSSELPEGANYLLEIKAVGRATATESHTFKASLLINRPAGQAPIIAWQDIEKNSKTGQTLVFSINSNNNLVVTATAGAPLNGYIYRFFEHRYMQA